MKQLHIGILALQGDVSEHAQAVTDLGSITYAVRTKQDLTQVNALIIPGGESTTLGKLMKATGLDTEIINKTNSGMPVYGTCMGLILLAKQVTSGSAPGQALLGLIDIKVKRNAYGRQCESFQTRVSIPAINTKEFPCIFIRAPQIESVGPHIEVLASLDGKPILVRERHVLGSTFHPELTNDRRIHKYFLQIIKTSLGSNIKDQD